MIHTETAYKRNDRYFETVMVDAVRKGRVEYREIRHWNYGVPLVDGTRRSMAITKFEGLFDEIEWVMC